MQIVLTKLQPLHHRVQHRRSMLAIMNGKLHLLK